MANVERDSGLLTSRGSIEEIVSTIINDINSEPFDLKSLKRKMEHLRKTIQQLDMGCDLKCRVYSTVDSSVDWKSEVHMCHERIRMLEEENADLMNKMKSN